MLLGVHVAQSSKTLDDKKTRQLHETLKLEMDILGLNSAQIFVSNPRTSLPAKINYDALQQACSDIDLSVHSPYASVGIWKVNNDNKTTPSSKQKIGMFKNQMELTQKAGAWCLVLHITKLLPENVVETMNIIKPIAKQTGVKIGLEMVANKADREKTYETPEKIDNLIMLLGQKTYYGIVVDTSHIHGAGIDCSSYESMKNWFDRLTYKKRIVMFHLNGSYAERGSGKDKHAIPFSAEDKIWHGIEPSKSGVRAVVEFANQHSIPMIVEVNRGTQAEVVESLEIIKQLGGAV